MIMRSSFRNFRTGILLAACLVSVSCAPRWQKPGSTDADFEVEKTICEKNALERFPKLLRQEQISAEDTTPPSIYCSASGGSSVRCVTTGSRYVPPMFRVVDDNESARTQDYTNCLLERGWKPTGD